MSFVRSSFDGRRKILTVRLKGDLLSTNAEAVAEEFQGVLNLHAQNDWESVSLDMKPARMVDSTGLNALLAFVKRLQEKGYNMRIVITSPVVARIFHFSLLDEMAEVVMHEKTR